MPHMTLQVLQRFEGVARMPLQPPAPLSAIMDMALELEIARGAWAVGAEPDLSRHHNIALSCWQQGSLACGCVIHCSVHCVYAC